MPRAFLTKICAFTCSITVLSVWFRVYGLIQIFLFLTGKSNPSFVATRIFNLSCGNAVIVQAFLYGIFI